MEHSPYIGVPIFFTHREKLRFCHFNSGIVKSVFVEFISVTILRVDHIRFA